MNRTWFVLAALFFALGPGARALAWDCDCGTVRLASFQIPPYVGYEPGRGVDGLAVDVVRRAMDEVGCSQTMAVSSEQKARLMVKTGKVQGFFPVPRDHYADGFAILSAYVAEEKLNWYLPSDSGLDPESDGFKAAARLGAVRGSRAMKWLRDNGYDVVMEAPGAGQLARVLALGGLDAGLADEAVIGPVIEREGLERKLKAVPVLEVPLGVYFSKRFIEGCPEFLEHFNRAVWDIRGQ